MLRAIDNVGMGNMTIGICKLCQKEKELLNSHVIPAFAFRWLKSSSGHGKIRKGTDPNRRVQDGEKRYWLCSECESILNQSETSFSNALFYPYIERSGEKFHYSSWLLHFCTSMSWRVLTLYIEDHYLNDWPESELQLVNKAERIWRDYLLGLLPHPGEFRQYLIPFDQIECTDSPMVPNINRYLMRAIDTDICRNKDTIFVYSKIGRFVHIGVVKPHKRNIWQGARVNANNGVIEPRKYVLHKAFWQYVLVKAQRAAELLGSVSDNQQKKIDYSFKNNLDKYIHSDAFKAMSADVKAFGEDAFCKKR